MRWVGPTLKIFFRPALGSLRCEMLDIDDPLSLGGYGDDFGRRRGAPRSRAAPKVPVSILCGFLGAGKTTMVQHVLKNREGLKVGVVVNDVAEVNIDSEVLRFEDADGIVGLQNGCACCSGRADLFARLEELVESTGITKLEKGWDRLVVECSGVAEPESIAAELEDRAKTGDQLMKRLFLAGIICVIDASCFWEMYNSGDQGDQDRKPLSSLLVSQLESADTVVINKTDLVSSEELSKVSKLLKALSPNARQFESIRGQLPLRTLLPAEPIDMEMPAYVPTLANRHSAAVRSVGMSTAHVAHASGHGHSHEGAEGDCSECAAPLGAARHERFGISSFVYRQDRWFHPERLAALIRRLPVTAANISFDKASDPVQDQLFAGVLRSKGFVRTCDSDQSFYWSHAGRRVEVFPTATSAKSQEVVFIGTGLDQAAISAALDACVATDAECAKL
ncbi:unnamed protein product [Durusdinium trenchii]|uniref:Metal chaperone YciC n=2 Tax=Durusdinium trenchii TaxID=1381693 RepID=A0ABP0RH37_9DINO